MHKKFFFEKIFFDPKNLEKRDFLDQKIVKKMAKSKNFVKIFLFGIDSECFETYFKTKISKSKFFPITNFFWDLVIFGQNGLNSEKMTKSKILVENLFWSESIQNRSKRTLNWKSRNRNFFHVKIFFLDLFIVLPKCPK